jgi:hypothetical protein
MLLVIGLGVIALFAIAAILIDPSAGYQEPHDPHNDLPIWAVLGRR